MRSAIAESIFWLHFLVVVFWVGLFFVPASWWQDKVSFHFFLTLGIAGHQYVWGAVITPWTRRFRPVCILTTLMQWMRGKGLSQEGNYSHVWTDEFFSRMGQNMPKKGAGVMTWTILLLVTLQYFFFR